MENILPRWFLRSAHDSCLSPPAGQDYEALIKAAEIRNHSLLNCSSGSSWPECHFISGIIKHHKQLALLFISSAKGRE